MCGLSTPSSANRKWLTLSLLWSSLISVLKEPVENLEMIDEFVNVNYNVKLVMFSLSPYTLAVTS